MTLANNTLIASIVIDVIFDLPHLTFLTSIFYFVVFPSSSFIYYFFSLFPYLYWTFISYPVLMVSLFSLPLSSSLFPYFGFPPPCLSLFLSSQKERPPYGVSTAEHGGLGGRDHVPAGWGWAGQDLLWGLHPLPYAAAKRDPQRGGAAFAPLWRLWHPQARPRPHHLLAHQ